MTRSGQPVESQTLMREFAPATMSPDLSLPMQPWTSSLRLGGRSLCPLAELTPVRSHLAGAPYWPLLVMVSFRASVLPAMVRIRQRGHMWTRHWRLASAARWNSGPRCQNTGQGPASDGSPMRWDERPGCDHVSRFFFSILYIFQEVSRLSFLLSCPVHPTFTLT